MKLLFIRDKPETKVGLEGETEKSYSWTFTPSDTTYKPVTRTAIVKIKEIEKKDDLKPKVEKTKINEIYNEDNRKIYIKVDKAVTNEININDFLINGEQKVIGIEKIDNNKTIILTLSEGIAQDATIEIKENAFKNESTGGNEKAERLILYKPLDNVENSNTNNSSNSSNNSSSSHSHNSNKNDTKEKIDFEAVGQILKKICDYLNSQYSQYKEQWILVGNNWYYLNEKCLPVTSQWIEYKQKWYYVGENGVMKTGWFYDKDYQQWYYLNKDGSMKTGWFYDDNYQQWYYLKGHGAMAHNEYIDGYWLDESGKLI